jgi:hypothetical protein
LAYPLALKAVLAKAGHYVSTDADRALTIAFEQLLCVNHYDADVVDSREAAWAKIVSNARLEVATATFLRTTAASPPMSPSDPDYSP